jgi:rhodanese-related sulfurtransferase
MQKRNNILFINILLLCIIAIILSIYIILNFGANGNYLILTEVDELDKLYLSNDPKLLFIDLRDSKDYEAGHIDKYINIPFSKDDKDTLLNFLEKNNYKDKTIVLMCYSSKRASEAFNLLTQLSQDNNESFSFRNMGNALIK